MCYLETRLIQFIILCIEGWFLVLKTLGCYDLEEI